jgi:hypothetical protein
MNRTKIHFWRTDLTIDLIIVVLCNLSHISWDHVAGILCIIAHHSNMILLTKTKVVRALAMIQLASREF